MEQTPHQKIEGWFKEETDLLIAKGATADDLREEAFEELLADNVYKRRGQEINDNLELLKEVLTVTLINASPETLREFASQLRASGLTDRAYDLEELADARQRDFRESS
jgi:hypothetical protein